MSAPLPFSLSRPIAIVDVETTGGSPLYHRIIEIGIVRIDPGKEPRTFSTLAIPGRQVSPFILDLTGIKSEELDKAPEFAVSAPQILEMLEGAVFIAHNASFDYAFVKYEFARMGISFSAPKLCSVRFSRYLYPQYREHGLSALIERFKLPVTNRHRALGDAQAVWDFFCCAHAEKQEAFMSGMEHLLSRPMVQTHLPPEKLENLPEGPGVYLFYGERGEILYVGKSANLCERIQNHFLSQNDWKDIESQYWYHPAKILRLRYKTGKRVKERII